MTGIDAKQNMVTVKASVDTQTLIQKLNKSGIKRAELCHAENPIDNDNGVNDDDDREIKEPSGSKDEQKQNSQIEAATDSLLESKLAKVEQGTETSRPVAKLMSSAAGKAHETEKADKSKYDTDHHHHQVVRWQPGFTMSHSTAQGSISQLYYVYPMATASQSQAYMYADQFAPPGYYNSFDSVHSAAPMHQPADPYNNMFSDENQNACSVM